LMNKLGEVNVQGQKKRGPIRQKIERIGARGRVVFVQRPPGRKNQTPSQITKVRKFLRMSGGAKEVLKESSHFNIRKRAYF